MVGGREKDAVRVEFHDQSADKQLYDLTEWSNSGRTSISNTIRHNSAGRLHFSRFYDFGLFLILLNSASRLMLFICKNRN